MIRQAPLIKSVFIFCTALMLPAAANAQKFGEIVIEPTLVAETDMPKPGSTVRIALQMSPKPGWHGYWINGGDASQPDKFNWSLPAGYSVGAFAYPTPKKLTLLGVTNHVYEAEYGLLADLKLPANAVLGTRVPITLDAFYLACSDKVCLPQKAQRRLDLVVGSGQVDEAKRALFDAWQSKMPTQFEGASVFRVSDGQIRIRLTPKTPIDLENAWFFVQTPKLIDYAAPQDIREKDGKILINLKARDNVEPKKISGTLALASGQALHVDAEYKPKKRNRTGQVMLIMLMLGLFWYWWKPRKG